MRDRPVAARGAGANHGLRRNIRQVGYPRSTPPPEYMHLPIYGTYVQIRGTTQDKVLEFGRTIRNHILPAGVI